MTMFKNVEETMSKYLNENLDIQLDQIETDDTKVLDAIETIKNHLIQQKPSEIKDFNIGKKHGEKEDYIYIYVSGICFGCRKNPRGKGISIINQVKHKIAQSDIDLVLGKIKEMFEKQD